MTAYRFLFVVN